MSLPYRRLVALLALGLQVVALTACDWTEATPTNPLDPLYGPDRVPTAPEAFEVTETTPTSVTAQWEDRSSFASGFRVRFHENGIRYEPEFEHFTTETELTIPLANAGPYYVSVQAMTEQTSSSYAEVFRLWRPIRYVNGVLPGFPDDMAVSASGTVVVSGGDDDYTARDEHVTVVDVETSTVTDRLEDCTAPVSVSSVGHVSARCGATVVVYEQGQEVLSVPIEEGAHWQRDQQLSEDGTHLAVLEAQANTGWVRVIRLRDGQEVAHFTFFGEWRERRGGLALSADGRRVAVATAKREANRVVGQRIRSWDIAYEASPIGEGALWMRDLPGDAQTMESFHYTPDGAFLCVALSETFRLLDPQAGGVVYGIDGVSVTAVARTGRYVLTREPDGSDAVRRIPSLGISHSIPTRRGVVVMYDRRVYATGWEGGDELAVMDVELPWQATLVD